MHTRKQTGKVHGAVSDSSSQKQPWAGSKTAFDKHSNVAEARDALDAAILFGAEAVRRDDEGQRQHFKQMASDALGLALLAEARDSGITVVPSGLLRAKQTAQGSLDFTLLTEPSLNIDAQILDRLKVHAEDAVQVGLLAMQRIADGSEEALSPCLQDSALEALELLLSIASSVLRGHLSEQDLCDARQRAQDAVTRAVECEAKCSCIEATPEELQQACERAYVALESVTLAEPDMGALALVKQRALNALHLALLGLESSG